MRNLLAGAVITVTLAACTGNRTEAQVQTRGDLTSDDAAVVALEPHTLVAVTSLQDWRNFADWVGLVTVVSETPTQPAVNDDRAGMMMRRDVELRLEKPLFSRTSSLAGTLDLSTTGWARSTPKGPVKPFKYTGAWRLEVGNTYLVALTQFPARGTGEENAVSVGPDRWGLLTPGSAIRVVNGKLVSPLDGDAATATLSGKTLTEATATISALKADALVEKYADLPGWKRYTSVLSDREPTSRPGIEGP